MHKLTIISSLVILATTSGLISFYHDQTLAQTAPAVNAPLASPTISTVDQHQKQNLGNSQSIGTIEVSPTLKPESQAAIVLPVKTIERPVRETSLSERVLPNLGDAAKVQPAALNQSLFNQQFGPGFGLIHTDL